MKLKSHLIIGMLATAFAGAAWAQTDNPPQVNPTFVKLDANHDKFVTRAEASGNKDLLSVFDKADLNKDGKLDEDEYLKAVSMYQREKTSEYAGDTAVTTKVKTALLSAKGLHSTAVSVETYKGQVQLSGFVESADQAAQAGKVAAGVSGVKSVQNNLTVK